MIRFNSAGRIASKRSPFVSLMRSTDADAAVVGSTRCLRFMISSASFFNFGRLSMILATADWTSLLDSFGYLPGLAVHSCEDRNPVRENPGMYAHVFVGNLWEVEATTGVPNRIRTGVAAVKGRCPRPLDDGDVSTAAG